jgi:hypothetical protein
MDPRIRIRIHPKISWIRNAGSKALNTQIFPITIGFLRTAGVKFFLLLAGETNAMKKSTKELDALCLPESGPKA